MFNNKIDGMGQVRNVNFGLKDTQSVQCTECQGAVFQNGVMFRKVSKILAGTDKDALVPINIPYCVNCLEPLDDLLPSELRKQKFSL